MAFLDPDDINVNLVVSRPDLLDHPLSRKLAHACNSRIGVQQTVGALLSTGLLSRLDDEHVRMHRLVGLVTRHQLQRDPEVASAWAELVIVLLCRLLPESRYSTMHLEFHLAAHIAVAANHTPAVADTAHALHRLARAQSITGDPAIEVTLQRAMAIEKTLYGTSSAEVASTLHKLGRSRLPYGDFAGQAALLDQALAIETAVYGASASKVVSTLQELGVAHLFSGKLAESRASPERALQIQSVHEA